MGDLAVKRYETATALRLSLWLVRDSLPLGFGDLKTFCRGVRAYPEARRLKPSTFVSESGLASKPAMAFVGCREGSGRVAVLSLKQQTAILRLQEVC